MHILSVKKICLYLCSKFDCVIFAVLYFPFWYFLRHLDIKNQKLGCKWACKTKKLTTILKNFVKQPVITQSPTFLSFSFFIDCCIIVFFSFLIKASANFKKLVRFDWQDFIVYKNGENFYCWWKYFAKNL